MNMRERVGNQPDVTPSTVLLRSVTALVALVVAGGCAKPPEAPLGAGPGRCAIGIFAASHVSPPFRIKSITTSIDGQYTETTSGRGLPSLDAEQKPIATAVIPSGKHTLWVRATVSDRSGDRVLTLGAQQGFRVGTQPATIVMHIYTPRDASSAEALPHVEVAFWADKGRLDPLVGAAPPALTGPERCNTLPAAGAAVCRTEIMLNQAISEHDSIRAACVQDKLSAMRRVARFVDDDRSDAAQPAVDRPVTDVIADRMHRLEQRAGSCPTATAAAIDTW
jgi:hypothetical protein